MKPLAAVVDEFSPIQLGYYELLKPIYWQRFNTFTFHSPVHPEQADKAFRLFISRCNVELFGQNYNKYKNLTCIQWVRALEWQKRGVLHYHTLETGMFNMRRHDQIPADVGVGDEGYLKWHLTAREQQQIWLEITDSFSKCVDITAATNTIALVIAYLSKYVTKDSLKAGGEIDISANLGPEPQLILDIWYGIKAD